MFFWLPLYAPLLLFTNSIDCLAIALDLYGNRYCWEAESTFYYHWYHGESSAIGIQKQSQIKYTHWYGYGRRELNLPLQTLDEYKFEIALFYPDLINNAQFICCFEEDDPNHELAGRVPYIGKLEVELPYYDHEYALKHYYSYNKRYMDYVFNAEGEVLFESNYFRERRLWRKQFKEHHACYGEYFRWVHEYPNTAEYREENDERPSNFPPKPHSIVKEPKGAYIEYFSYGVGLGGLFLLLAQKLLF